MKTLKAGAHGRGGNGNGHGRRTEAELEALRANATSRLHGRGKAGKPRDPAAIHAASRELLAKRAATRLSSGG